MSIVDADSIHLRLGGELRLDLRCAHVYSIPGST